MKVIGIIPARYASTRLLGKPLIPILGKPMVQRVYEQTMAARLIDDVWVATDDQRILQAVESFGGKAVMTSTDCVSGTDRLAEAVKIVGGDIVVNVQGDQPFIDPQMIDESVQPLLDDPELPMATLIHPIHQKQHFSDPGVVKAVVDLQGNGMYFSRSLIPAPHNDVAHQVYEHVGLYVYQRDFLIKLAGLPQTLLERVEGLEQLRVIEHGYKLRCVVTACQDTELSGFSVDTLEDVKRCEAMLNERRME